jgi:very-short-patch-repair endonuclease
MHDLGSFMHDICASESPRDVGLAEYRDVDDTRSKLERRFVEFCRDSQLPRPALNAIAAGFDVDALWADKRLVVELDSFGYHRSRAAFETDRARDRELQLAGYRVLRVTHRMLANDQATVRAAIRALLATGPGESGS